jgi:peptidoglycan/LPS O-acetylase OafA/YrhL
VRAIRGLASRRDVELGDTPVWRAMSAVLELVPRARPVTERLPVRRRRSRFGHQPALDGLRGLSVAFVLCFHGGWSWMTGGYVGVSVFFTLSGFLITRLLLDEYDTQGRINVVRFWGRRLRRLMPAGIACLLGVAALGSVGAFGDVADLGRDLRGAVLQIANWTALGGDRSYSERVLGEASPLDHVWSLAIEEQFYWVWPLVMVAALRSRRPERAVYTLTAVAVVIAPVVAVTFGPDAAYWATPARAGEILVGASLAVVLARRRSAPPRAVAVAGPPALAVIVWAAITWPAVGGPAYRGWLPLFALATAALLLAVQVRSPLRRALAWRPLVGLGVISYGVYLYHWPLFVLLDDRLGGGVVEFVVKVAATLLVAVWSYRHLEAPIRRGRGNPMRLARTLALASVLVLIVATFGSFGSSDRFADPSSAPDQLEPVAAGVLAPLTATPLVAASPATEPTVTPSLRRDVVSRSPIVSEDIPTDRSVTPSTSPTSVPPTAPTTAPAVASDVTVSPPGDVTITAVPSRPVRMLVVGDSTAWSAGEGLAAWAEANPSLASVTLTVSPGCGFLGSGTVPADDGASYRDDCDRVLGASMMDAIATLQPDVVMLMVTRTDVKDRVWDEAEGLLPITDARFEQRITDEYASITRWILGTGVPHVAWVKPSVVRPDPAPNDEMADPQRMGVLHRVIDSAVTATDPTRVATIDLAAWYPTSGIDDATARIDGMHLEVPAATEVAARFLGPTLVNIALDTD